MPDKDEIILVKIAKYCADIMRYTKDMDENDFINDDRTVAACAFCLGQIGELSKKMSEDGKKSYSKVPWHKMYGLRNRIFHDYDGVNLSLLWTIVKNDIPNLKVSLKEQSKE